MEGRKEGRKLRRLRSAKTSRAPTSLSLCLSPSLSCQYLLSRSSKKRPSDISRPGTHPLSLTHPLTLSQSDHRRTRKTWQRARRGGRRRRRRRRRPTFFQSVAGDGSRRTPKLKGWAAGCPLRRAGGKTGGCLHQFHREGEEERKY